MSGSDLVAAVATILREVGEAVVLPRFRRLAAGDIEEKGPGDLVTVADRDAERLLTARLPDLRAGSRVVGEEACAARPALLDTVGDGRVWIVDPVDGTANFAAGREPFAMMVALLESGETVAAWIWEPATGRLCVAETGAGAEIDGRRVLTDPSPPAAQDLRGSVLTRYMPPEVGGPIERRLGGLAALTPAFYCAGAEYPAVLAGDRHFALFWRTLPWDHAPGTLILTEAGGRAARWDGTPYRPADPGRGLLVARNPAVWAAGHAALLA
ncbi:MAG: inositol monophosphatase family protein [Alphaproteobacteria bacterium]